MRGGSAPGIFGTDGVRDRAGSGFLAPEAIVRIVEALVGFIGHATPASAVARPMSALQVSSIAEALREAS